MVALFDFLAGFQQAFDEIIHRGAGADADEVWPQHAAGFADIDGFAKSGGMVEFSLGGEGAAVSILINRKAAQKQHLEFNAQLLRLAKAIDP